MQADLPMLLFLSFSSVTWGLLSAWHGPAIVRRGAGVGEESKCTKHWPLTIQEGNHGPLVYEGREAPAGAKRCTPS